MKPSQASPASVCFAGVTSSSDSVVCLWIKLLACQYSYSHSLHPLHPPTSHGSSISPIQLGLFVALSGLGLVLRFVDFSAFNGLLPIPHAPASQQHLFNFLCGAIRAKHAPLFPQSLPSSNLKWKVVCHINTHAICTSFRWKEHKNDMFRPYLWAVNSNTAVTKCVLWHLIHTRW